METTKYIIPRNKWFKGKNFKLIVYFSYKNLRLMILRKNHYSIFTKLDQTGEGSKIMALRFRKRDIPNSLLSEQKNVVRQLWKFLWIIIPVSEILLAKDIFSIDQRIGNLDSRHGRLNLRNINIYKMIFLSPYWNFKNRLLVVPRSNAFVL